MEFLVLSACDSFSLNFPQITASALKFEHASASLSDTANRMSFKLRNPVATQKLQDDITALRKQSTTFYDSEISRLMDMVQYLQASQIRTRNMLDHAQYARSPTARLPIELLSLIFLLVNNNPPTLVRELTIGMVMKPNTLTLLASGTSATGSITLADFMVGDMKLLVGNGVNADGAAALGKTDSDTEPLPESRSMDCFAFSLKLRAALVRLCVRLDFSEWTSWGDTSASLALFSNAPNLVKVSFDTCWTLVVEKITLPWQQLLDLSIENCSWEDIRPMLIACVALQRLCLRRCEPFESICGFLSLLEPENHSGEPSELTTPTPKYLPQLEALDLELAGDECDAPSYNVLHRVVQACREHCFSTNSCSFPQLNVEFELENEPPSDFLQKFEELAKDKQLKFTYRTSTSGSECPQD
ncbi:hypothetical protein FISHEDRAFT_70470 [Fistulina hepatica ATCC 64428]|uniref:Uncharacterized protein n=1 Tax=Fistulina hepatica ATCC 64428 TaxID=1128425 RepID=A0A0D7ALT4_9AGAR|nr:hypothetical protein FISHEDRAFT_70470 [Fistulina hepatica ATCC 64428]